MKRWEKDSREKKIIKSKVRKINPKKKIKIKILKILKKRKKRKLQK